MIIPKQFAEDLPMQLGTLVKHVKQNWTGLDWN